VSSSHLTFRNTSVLDYYIASTKAYNKLKNSQSKSKWSSPHKDRFIQKLNTQEIEQILQIAENNPSQINIDQISQTLSTCFTNSAEQSFPSQKKHIQ